MNGHSIDMHTSFLVKNDSFPGMCSFVVGNWAHLDFGKTGYLRKIYRNAIHVLSQVSFSSCQQNLIKTFQIEGMIALISKTDLIFS